MSVYIHVPFCLKKCHYCVFPTHIVGTSAQNVEHFRSQIEDQYVSALVKDIKQFLPSSLPLKTLYFGGGTPSLLHHSSLEKILKCFAPSPQAEITLEADPGTFTRSHLQAWRDLGINRLSLGIQSLRDTTLTNLNRSHKTKQIEEAINNILKVYGSLYRCSIDMLYNLPNGYEDPFGDIQHVATQMKPGHLSLYSLQIEEGSYFFERLKYREEQFPLPSNPQQALQFRRAHELLKRAGYDHYEISNWSVDEETQSKHNQVYWRGDSEFFGFGMGAATLQNGIRTTRPRRLKEYFRFVESQQGCTVEEERSEKERLRVLLMSRLRTKWGMEKDLLPRHVREKFDTELSDYFQDDKRSYKLKIPDGFLVCDEIVSVVI